MDRCLPGSSATGTDVTVAREAGARAAEAGAVAVRAAALCGGGQRGIGGRG
jgi:hypothetical protein